MASVDMTITYDDEIGTPADMGETLTLLVSFPGLNPEKFGAAENVGDALRQLGEHEGLLLSKIALSVAVRDEAAADKLIADLEMHLAERPYSVSVKFEKVAPGHFRHGTFDRRTPIDEAIRRAGGIVEFAQRRGVDAVTLSSGGQSVTLTAETEQRAAEMLRKSIAAE